MIYHKSIGQEVCDGCNKTAACISLYCDSDYAAITNLCVECLEGYAQEVRSAQENRGPL